jgi:VWA domain containing CoxE-like protein
MLESAIFSAVMASIFAELPSIKTSLILFDTQVVDLSDQVGKPVDVLLSVSLGGGTDITSALQYSQQLAREPSRSIVVLITDFYEGRPEDDLVRVVRNMAQSGIRMIGLGALGYSARPEYNRQTAKKCKKVGMDIRMHPRASGRMHGSNHSRLTFNPFVVKSIHRGEFQSLRGEISIRSWSISIRSWSTFNQAFDTLFHELKSVPEIRFAALIRIFYVTNAAQ